MDRTTPLLRRDNGRGVGVHGVRGARDHVPREHAAALHAGAAAAGRAQAPRRERHCEHSVRRRPARRAACVRAAARRLDTGIDDDDADAGRHVLADDRRPPVRGALLAAVYDEDALHTYVPLLSLLYCNVLYILYTSSVCRMQSVQYRMLIYCTVCTVQ